MKPLRFPRFGTPSKGAERQTETPPLKERFVALCRDAWDAKPVAGVRGVVKKSLESAREVTGAFAAADVMGEAHRSLRTHFGLILGFSAAINLLYLAPSLYMLQVYDRVIPTSGVLTLVLLSIVLVASLSVLALLDAARSRLMTRTSLRIERIAADAVIEQSMKARRLGVRPQATVRDLDTLRQGVTSPAATGLLDIPWTPLFIAICFMIHLWIGALALFGALLIFALALVNERATRDSLSQLSTRAGAFYMAHDTDLNAAETVHALGAGSRLRQRRAHSRASYVDAQTDSSFKGAGYAAATKALRMFLQSAALGLGAYLAVQREISPGAIIAATILTARAFAPVEQIVGGWRQIGQAIAAYAALRAMFAEAKVKQPRTPLPTPTGRIQLEQVAALAPDGRTVSLQNVSFATGPGEIVGIIGPSGAGKTTLARVLANAATVKAGAVRIDGARYADWDEEKLASHIGYMPQRIDLFDGTVAQNIAAYAATDHDGQPAGPSIVNAAILAGAHEMILRLPNGYETELGPSGAGISPGQAQRIALARALFGNPALLVLDEPNSHLDADGELALVKAIQAVKERGGQVFVVAHRAGVLAVADKIAVLQEGRIVDFGQRSTVLAKLSAMSKSPTPNVALVGGQA
jgi:PrtD family type I secretion system ABC transporter